MKNYKGWNFQDWCNLQPDDERKINYTLRGIWDGKKQEASVTSEDDVDMMMLFRIQQSTIKTLKLIDNEWHVTLLY